MGRFLFRRFGYALRTVPHRGLAPSLNSPDPRRFVAGDQEASALSCWRQLMALIAAMVTTEKSAAMSPYSMAVRADFNLQCVASLKAGADRRSISAIYPHALKHSELHGILTCAHVRL